jgi:uncharacterized protein with NRDE domain
MVAANRDEHLDRPAEPPALRRTAVGDVVAPLDLQAGGTWLGVSVSGLFAAVTNRPVSQRDASRRSRGLAVVDALGHGRARAAAAAFERLTPGLYNPFNLFVADPEEAFAVVYEGAPKVFQLRPGAHVIGNGDPDDPRTPRVARLLEGARAAADASRPLDRLAELCRDHADRGPSRGAPTCVHGDRYGTRSCTLLQLGSPPQASIGLHADGPPCRTEFQDFTPLLRRLHDAEGVPAARSIH